MAKKKPKKKKTAKKPVKKIVKKAKPRKAVAKPKRKVVSLKKPPVTKPRLSPAVKTKRKMEGIEKALRLATTGKRDLLIGNEEIVSQSSDSENGERKIVESKFNIGVLHNAQAMPLKDLPGEYGNDRVALLVIDPRFVFSYWEIKNDTLKRAMEQAGFGAKLTLRFYDITSTGNPETSPSWDVEVFDRLGNWYLKLSHPGQRVCLDVGVKKTSGEFLHIARSNVMRLPQETLARPGPIKWMIVTPSGEKLISETEEYTDADMELLKKILGPYFYDLLMRGRFASIMGSSIEAIFYDISTLGIGESPAGKPPWITS